MDIPEADWKRLRRVHAAALDRFCDRVLGECEAMLDDSSGSAHDRYLRLFRHLKDRDRLIAWAFDDMRRSRGIERLAAMIEVGAITADELAQFTPVVRGRAEGIVALRSASPDL